ncbi:MAG: hypothetical protein H7Z19_19985, partial [Chitinophagaceae bacterium]|nr:hypothetical protein [Rubrivivax sp.]
AEVVERLLPLSDADAAFIRPFADVRLSNWNGIEVGRLSAVALQAQVARG